MDFKKNLNLHLKKSVSWYRLTNIFKGIYLVFSQIKTLFRKIASWFKVLVWRPSTTRRSQVRVNGLPQDWTINSYQQCSMGIYYRTLFGLVDRVQPLFVRWIVCDYHKEYIFHHIRSKTPSPCQQCKLLHALPIVIWTIRVVSIFIVLLFYLVLFYRYSYIKPCC